MKRSKDYIHPTDYQYVPTDPDPDFDPEHNKRVIAETIKKNEILSRAKERQFDEKVAERNNAAATYLKSLQQGGRARTPEGYFGSKYIAYLRGQTIISTLQTKMAQLKKDTEGVK